MISGGVGNATISPGLGALYAYIIHHKRRQNFLYLIIWVNILLNNN